MTRRPSFALPAAGLAAAAAAAAFFSADPRAVSAQAEPAPAALSAESAAQIREMDELVRAIGQQQLEIAKNLQDIEAKMSELEESLRQARIFSARTARQP